MQLDSEPWFVGEMSRDRAEEKLVSTPILEEGERGKRYCWCTLPSLSLCVCVWYMAGGGGFSFLLLFFLGLGSSIQGKVLFDEPTCPGRDASLADSVLTLRAMLTWTVPIRACRLSSEIHRLAFLLARF